MTRILAIKTILMMSLASTTMTVAVTAALAVRASATGRVFDRLAEFVL